MNSKNLVILGAFDGTTTGLGMMLSLAITGNYKGLLIGALSLAVGAAFSMGGGEWLSEDRTNWNHAIVMACASFIGTSTPAIPLLITHSIFGYISCGILVLGMLATIAYERPESFIKSFIRTSLVLIVAAGVAMGLALVV